VRVAVIGAGVGGLYCAWRLSNEGNDDLKITVLESRGVVGGRIGTHRALGAGLAELGAMRFVASHALLLGLLDRLELSTEPFPQALPRKLLLRGRQLPPELLLPTWKPDPGFEVPYGLRAELRGAGPHAVLQFLLREILPEANPTVFSDAKRLERMLAEGRFRGRPFHHYGFWNLAEYILTTEEFTYLRDTVGIESVVGNWNTHRAIVLIGSLLRGFGQKDPLRTISGGMGKLTAQLRKKLNRSKAEIVLNAHVVAVEIKKSGVKLGIVDRKGRRRSRTFDELILAIPPAAMAQISFTPKPLSLTIEKARKWVRPVDATRIYLRYRRAWWPDLGYGITTLPLRQVYYWTGTDSRREKGLLMASYTDAASSEFWDDASVLPVRPGTRGSSIKVFSRARIDGWLVSQVQKLLREIHPEVSHIPEPTHAAVIQWDADAFSGAAWHAWRPQVNASKKMRAIRHPMNRIHIVGEAWSDSQGWIEGALSSSEHILTDYFDVKPLVNGHYLGP
jgi:monoamine oxidase